MKTTRILGLALAAVTAIGVGSAAPAQNMDKAANLQAMRWYAEQQMAQGLPNPYPSVNLVTGEGFRELTRSGANPYYANGYGVNPYGVNQYGVNPYGLNQYGVNQYRVNPNYQRTPLYGYGGSPWF